MTSTRRTGATGEDPPVVGTDFTLRPKGGFDVHSVTPDSTYRFRISVLYRLDFDLDGRLDRTPTWRREKAQSLDLESTSQTLQ